MYTVNSKDLVFKAGDHRVLGSFIPCDSASPGMESCPPLGEIRCILDCSLNDCKKGTELVEVVRAQDLNLVYPQAHIGLGTPITWTACTASVYNADVDQRSRSRLECVSRVPSRWTAFSEMAACPAPHRGGTGPSALPRPGSRSLACPWYSLIPGCNLK